MITSQFAELQFQLGDLLSTILLLRTVLVEIRDDDLTINMKTGEKLKYTGIAMASGEVLDSVGHDLYHLNHTFDSLCGKLRRGRDFLKEVA